MIPWLARFMTDRDAFRDDALAVLMVLSFVVVPLVGGLFALWQSRRKS